MTRYMIPFSVLTILALSAFSADASAQVGRVYKSGGQTWISQTGGPSTNYADAMQAHGPRTSSTTSYPSTNQMTTQQRINTIYQRGSMTPAQGQSNVGGGLPMRDSLRGLTAATNFYPQQYQFNYQQAQFNAQQLQKSIQDLGNAIRQARQNRQQRLNNFNNNYRRRW